MRFVFSIIIPVRNEQRTIGILLDRLNKISSNYSTEIIIIDSESSDRTREIVEERKAKTLELRLIKIKKMDFNHGDTRNMGVRIARGEYVCFLSGDAIPQNDFLKFFQEDFKMDKKVMAVFGKQIPYPDTPFVQKIELLRIFDELGKFTSKGRLIQDKKNPFIPFNDQNRPLWYSLFNPFSSYRRSFLLKNPFPEVNYGEDFLLGKKIIDGGFIKIYDSRARVTHSHRYNLAQYYKREKSDLFLRTVVFKFQTKGHPAFWKIRKIRDLRVNFLVKTYYLFQLVLYYIIKLIVIAEIRTKGYSLRNKYW